MYEPARDREVAEFKLAQDEAVSRRDIEKQKNIETTEVERTLAVEQAQVAIAKAAVSRFDLSADVLAFDTTNFDTHIDTQTPGELARRGHAKSKRKDLRVVGLGVLVSETGHVRAAVPVLSRQWLGPGRAGLVYGRFGAIT